MYMYACLHDYQESCKSFIYSFTSIITKVLAITIMGIIVESGVYTTYEFCLPILWEEKKKAYMR